MYVSYALFVEYLRINFYNWCTLCNISWNLAWHGCYIL